MPDTNQNKAVIRRIFDEVINHGKIEVVDDLFDPENPAS
jgi:hypothetical protein